MKLDINKIVQARLDKDQFYAEESKKTQIYLHHTAGGGNAVAVSRYWNSNDTRIATAFVIGENGHIVQCFSSKCFKIDLDVLEKKISLVEFKGYILFC